MGSQGSGDDGVSTRQTKVSRVIDEYDLNGIGAEMEEQWQKTGTEHTSLRDLADYFNRRLLAEVIGRTGGKTLPGEVENLYEILTGENVNTADRTRVKRSLERDGVDIEETMQDFVTHQAVHTYLKRDRDAVYTPEQKDRKAAVEEHVQRLRGRMTSVIEGHLEQVANSGDLTLGNFKVFIDTRVFCEDCSTQIEITELLKQGGCNCESTD